MTSYLCSLMDLMLIGLLVIDFDGKIIDVNWLVVCLFGVLCE